MSEQLQYNRKIRARADAAELLLDMIRPLKNRYSEGRARLKLGDTAAHYGETAAQMEGFARILWGLGPLWAQDNADLKEESRKEANEWLKLYREGIIHGTDPAHEEYWGEVIDYDQKMVEIAALASAFCLAPQKLWEPLSREQKEQVYRWFNQINDRAVHPNNWRYFRILVNVMWRRLGLPWSEERMKEDRGIIEGCYTDGGWYYDGVTGQVDYYIPFAIQFYGLIYAGLMEKEDGKYAEILKKRADSFSRDFVYWFNNAGEEIAYGRSLTYRFAHSAFFSAMAFAGVEGPGYGVMKKLVFGNLKTWLERPIFDTSGALTIGYGYPNLFMSERYNSPGSPYWAFKTFYMLALSPEHPFWQAEEADYPYEKRKLLPYPHMLVFHEDNGHVLAFTAGQHAKNYGHSDAKYEKFVYSNRLAFSVPRGFGLAEGAFDNTLAVSVAGEERYQMRWGTEEWRVDEQSLWIRYRMMPGVSVETTIIPWGSWHMRIHKIETEIAIDIADGGFAMAAEGEAAERTKSEARGLTGGTVELIKVFPNTNLLYPLTVIPTVRQNLEPGTHTIVNCFFGDAW